MKSQSPLLSHDRTSLVVPAVVGILAFAVVVLFALLAADVGDVRHGGNSPRCPGMAGTVDPVTCLPYGSGTAATPGTDNGAQKPGQKAPTAPKAPAAPPRGSLGKR